jgi:hypothetical protein
MAAKKRLHLFIRRRVPLEHRGEQLDGKMKMTGARH